MSCLQWIEWVLVCLGSLAGIAVLIFVWLAYNRWKEDPILHRKIYHMESCYQLFTKLSSALLRAYSPSQLFTMSTEGINVNCNDQLKQRIHEYRKEIISSERQHFSELESQKLMMCKYFQLDDFFKSFWNMWFVIWFITSRPISNCPNDLEKMLLLDDKFLTAYRNHLNSNNKFNINNESNVVIDKLNELEKQLDTEFNKLIQ